MELRRLALLRELERRGTIAAVAQSLSYSPSSVSVQLAELEREAGAQLLRRVGRNVELTAAGYRLAAHAEQALAADDAVRSELGSLAEAPRGRVRMTFVSTTAIALLPGALRRLAEIAPDVEVDIVQRETGPALEDLRSRAVDLVVGIEYDPLPVGRHRELDRQDLLREDVLLTTHPDDPLLTKRGPVRLAAFEGRAWATGYPGTGLDAALRNICNRLGGYDPLIRHRSDDAIVLGAVVAAGRAVALLSALFVSDMGEVAARRMREGRLQRTIFSVARGTTSGSPAIVAARDALRHTARRVAAGRTDLQLL